MKKTLIDKSFDLWMNNYPESTHPCDIERFYVFVKIAIRYKRYSKKYNSDWLRDKILKKKNYFLENRINDYCNLFNKLKDFYYTKPLNKDYYLKLEEEY